MTILDNNEFQNKVNKSEEKNKKRLFVTILSTFLFFGLFFGLFYFGYSQYKNFQNNISNINNGKDIVLGNVNNNKTNTVNFTVTINNKKEEFSNQEEFLSYINIFYQQHLENEYHFIGYEKENVLFEKKMYYKDFGFFINKESVINFVKNNLKDGKTDIIIKLSDFSYIDNNKIKDLESEIISEHSKNAGDIMFDKNVGFFATGSNMSFYQIQLIKEEKEKINLDNLKNITNKYYFEIKENNISEKIESLNKEYDFYKNLYIEYYIKSNNNQKNLSLLKQYLNKTTKFNVNIDETGLKIIFRGKDNLENIDYKNGKLFFENFKFFETHGNIEIPSSGYNISINNYDSFNITNTSVESNLSRNTDYYKNYYNNGLIILSKDIEDTINNYIDYVLLNNDKYEKVKPIVTRPFINNDPTVTITNQDGYILKILNENIKNKVYLNSQLNGFDKPIVIEDINNISENFGKKEFYINDSLKGYEDILFENDDIKCYLKNYSIINGDQYKIKISCNNSIASYSSTQQYIQNNYDMFGYDVDLIINKGEKFNIGDSYFNFNIIIDSRSKKDFNDLYNTLLENYINIPKEIIKSIEFKNNQFYIYFKNNGNDYWFQKYNFNYKEFLIYFIKFK